MELQVGQKRGVEDMMDIEGQLKKAAYEALEMAGHDSDSKSTASTRRTLSSDEAGSGHHSDSELHASPLSEEEEAARQLATIMMVCSGLARHPFKQQPLSAPAVMQSIPYSALDDDEHASSDDDDNSGDPSKAKKLRRREKNRASAQQSRQRKKYHLEQLEQRVEELERDKAALSMRLAALQHDNLSLKTRLPPPGNSPASPALGSQPHGAVCEGSFSEDDEEQEGVGFLAQLAETAQRLASA